MSFCWRSHIFSIFYLLNLFILISIHLCKYTQTSNLLDSFQKIFLNDFYWNNFYLLWVSLWYIPAYIMFILILSLFNSRFLNLKLIFIIFLSNIILVLSYYNFHNLNFYTLDVPILPISINSLLLNSINKIHPLLLYIVVVLIIQPTANLVMFGTNSVNHNFYKLFNN